MKTNYSTNILDKISTYVTKLHELKISDVMQDCVLYCVEDVKNIQNNLHDFNDVINLINNKFDIDSCEKYKIALTNVGKNLKPTQSVKWQTPIQRQILSPQEVLQPFNDLMHQNEKENEFLNCNINKTLGKFTTCSWQDVTLKNPFFQTCVGLLREYIKNDKMLLDLFGHDFNENIQKIQEAAWILTLPLLHPNKKIYIIYSADIAQSILSVFEYFKYIKFNVQLIIPFFNESAVESIIAYNAKINRSILDSTILGDHDYKQALIKQNLTKEQLTELLYHEMRERKLFADIISKIPLHIFWLNRDNIYLGCNNIQAIDLGLKQTGDIIGKKNSDLLKSQKDAELLDSINEIVFSTGEQYCAEEQVSMCRDDGNYLSYKIPLKNDTEEIIGLFGIAIDITDRKKAEALKLENQLQQTKIQEQEQFRHIVEQVAHDIRSPLASLSMIAESCKEIPEQWRLVLQSAAQSVNNIANDLLKKYQNNFEEDVQIFALHTAINDIFNQLQFAYKDVRLKMEFHPDLKHNFVFLEGNQSKFIRMISNLINNAIDAIRENTNNAKLIIKTKYNKQKVSIFIKDNGNGMTQEEIDNIYNNISFSHNKVNGHGIGLMQVKSALQAYNGNIIIESQKNVGTTVVLEIPTVNMPDYMVDCISFNKGDTIVILDDDTSIHHVWSLRLKEYAKEISIKHFKNGNNAVEFIESFYDKNKILLLSDYELSNQVLNGVQILQKVKLKNAVLVTNSYYDKKVIKLAQKYKIKILCKQLVDKCCIKAFENSNCNAVGCYDKAIKNIVVIDDNKTMLEAIIIYLKYEVKNINILDTYCSPYDFLENVHKYDKSTIIFIDFNLNSEINGFDLAIKLHEFGYSNLYILSGSEFQRQKVPDFLSVIVKGDINSFNKIFKG